MKDDTRFTAVDFPEQHPQQDVADHEVLMAFDGDDDAILFREWWHARGAAAFGKWLTKRKAEEP